MARNKRYSKHNFESSSDEAPYRSSETYNSGSYYHETRRSYHDHQLPSRRKSYRPKKNYDTDEYRPHLQTRRYREDYESEFRYSNPSSYRPGDSFSKTAFHIRPPRQPFTFNRRDYSYNRPYNQNNYNISETSGYRPNFNSRVRTGFNPAQTNMAVLYLDDLYQQDLEADKQNLQEKKRGEQLAKSLVEKALSELDNHNKESSVVYKNWLEKKKSENAILSKVKKEINNDKNFLPKKKSFSADEGYLHEEGSQEEVLKHSIKTIKHLINVRDQTLAGFDFVSLVNDFLSKSEDKEKTSTVIETCFNKSQQSFVVVPTVWSREGFKTQKQEISATREKGMFSRKSTQELSSPAMRLITAQEGNQRSEDIKRNINTILNRLTPDAVLVLANETVKKFHPKEKNELAIRSEEELVYLTELIFSNALEMHRYSSQTAYYCACLFGRLEFGKSSFDSILLEKCYKKFLKAIDYKQDGKNLAIKEHEKHLNKGVFIFLGNLFAYKAISSQIIDHIFKDISELRVLPFLIIENLLLMITTVFISLKMCAEKSLSLEALENVAFSAESLKGLDKIEQVKNLVGTSNANKHEKGMIKFKVLDLEKASAELNEMIEIQRRKIKSGVIKDEEDTKDKDDDRERRLKEKKEREFLKTIFLDWLSFQPEKLLAKENSKSSISFFLKNKIILKDEENAFFEKKKITSVLKDESFVENNVFTLFNSIIEDIKKPKFLVGLFLQKIIEFFFEMKRKAIDTNLNSFKKGIKDAIGLLFILREDFICDCPMMDSFLAEMIVLLKNPFNYLDFKNNKWIDYALKTYNMGYPDYRSDAKIIGEEGVSCVQERLKELLN